MSLVNPSSRWWNRNMNRRVAAFTCWIASTGLALFSSWHLWAVDGPTVPIWLTIVSSTLPIPLLLLGIFFYMSSFGSPSDGSPERALAFPLAAYFLANGIGGYVGGLGGPNSAWFINIVFIAGGLIAIIVTEVLCRRADSNARLRARVERGGVTTRGRVTRARSYSLNYRPVTRVTVEFTDTEGKTRWASQSVGGDVSTGALLDVRYSPADLGRSAAVVISGL